jgi:hypothetical protein
MSKMQDEKLEMLLKARQMEAASPDLAQRIIFKAQGIPQKRTNSLWQLLQQVFAEFHLAKPAYVLAATLLLGFIIGFSEPLGTTANDTDGAQVQSFLYADESIL